MFFGVDFDNTIADYDNLFFNLAFEKKYIPKEKKLGKKEIKEKLIAQGKEEDWRLLQSIAYGSRMIEADLASGFSDFVQKARSLDFNLSIVSHKTCFSNFTNNGVNLRDAALRWMDKHKFFCSLGFSEDEIFFEDSRLCKIRRIKHLNFSHFVDDLVEIFQNSSWPKNVKFLLLDKSKSCQVEHINKFSSWHDINNSIFN